MDASNPDRTHEYAIAFAVIIAVLLTGLAAYFMLSF